MIWKCGPVIRFDHWHPAEMAFTSRLPVSAAAREQFPHMRFVLGQKSSWITMPRAMLCLAPLAHSEVEASRGLQSVDSKWNLTTDFASSLKSILKSYLPDGYPPIELAAEVAGISVRTLQRRLARQGHSYTVLLQHLRYQSATRLLEDSGLIECFAGLSIFQGSASIRH